jgi:hypothetical protein
LIALIVTVDVLCPLAVLTFVLWPVPSSPRGAEAERHPVNVVLLGEADRLVLYNLGKEEIWIGGDKLGDTPPDMPKDGLLIPGVSPNGAQYFYYFLTQILSRWALTNVGRDGSKIFPFEVYVRDSAGAKFTAKFNLLIVMNRGAMTVNAHNLGVTAGGWPDRPLKGPPVALPPTPTPPALPAGR